MSRKRNSPRVENDSESVVPVEMLLVGCFSGCSFLMAAFVAIFVAACLAACYIYENSAALWALLNEKMLSGYKYLDEHQFIMLPMMAALLVLAYTLWKEGHKPKRAAGMFDPAIVLTQHVKYQTPIANANRAWWLAYYLGWIASTMAGFGITLLSGAINTADFLFGDMVTAICKLDPEFYKLAMSEPWLGYLLLTMVFLGFTASSLGKTFWLAKSRSAAVRNDPRRVLLLKLVEKIADWNAHIPIYNDLAESGGNTAEVMNLLEKRIHLIDEMNRMERRLAVAPLGSCSEISDTSEVPETNVPDTPVEDPREELLMEEAWKAACKEVDQLELPFTDS